MPKPKLIARLAAGPLKAALADTPVVLIHGPRQCGKTTLARQIAPRHRYLSFDDANLLAAARTDPVGFVARIGSKAILDEVQRVPELFPELKRAVDADRRPGRFLLTGSANLLDDRRLPDSLAGRIEVVRLHPFAQAELTGSFHRLLDVLLDGDLPALGPRRRGEVNLTDRMLAGGYPEAVGRAMSTRRRSWYRNYLDALLQRDAPDISGIRHAEALPRLLTRLAAQSAQLLNVADVAQGLAITRQTTDSYIGVLERLFLVERLAPWHSNRIKRLVKTPKVHVLDTGLLGEVMNLTPHVLKSDRGALGHVLETFVYVELRRQASAQPEPPAFWHFRDKNGVEVDIVIESSEGRFLGIEVKAAATVNAADFQGIERLRRALGKTPLFGVVAYSGEHLLRFGESNFAIPVDALWRM